VELGRGTIAIGYSAMMRKLIRANADLEYFAAAQPYVCHLELAITFLSADQISDRG